MSNAEVVDDWLKDYIVEVFRIFTLGCNKKRCLSSDCKKFFIVND